MGSLEDFKYFKNTLTISVCERAYKSKNLQVSERTIRIITAPQTRKFSTYPFP